MDIKVVGPDGTGYTSNLIKAIDWLIAHKDVYGVRVAWIGENLATPSTAMHCWTSFMSS